MSRTVGLFVCSLLVAALSPAAQSWEQVNGLPMAHQTTTGSMGTISNFFYVSGIGPSSGSGRLFVGLGPGGVYYSDNQGQTWTAGNAGLQDSFTGSTLLSRSFLNTGTSVIRGGTSASWNNHAGSGVFRSVNNGTSWTEASMFELVDVIRLVSGGGRIYAGSTLSGVHYSTDDGQTWTRWSTGLELPFGLVPVSRALAYHNGKIFAGVDLIGLMSSTDGVNWTPSDNGLPLNPQLIYRSSIVPLDLVVTPSGILYLLFAGESNADTKSVFRSTDSGASWHRVSFPGMFPDPGANSLWRMVNHGEDIIVGSTLLGGTNAQCFLYRPSNGWYALPTTGFIPSLYFGEAMTAVNGNYLFHTIGTNLFRLNLTTAPLAPVRSSVRRINGGGGINLGDSRTLTPEFFATLPASFQWFKDGVAIPGATSSNYTFTATGNDALGSYSVVVSNSGGSATNSTSIVTVAGSTLGTPDYSFNAGAGLVNTFNANCSVVCFPGSGFAYTMFRQPDGRIVVGGGFNAVGIASGTPMPTEINYQNSLIHLNPDGSLDTTFKKGSGPDNAVRQVVGLPDGRLIVCGPFRHFNGVPVPHIVRLHPDGSVDRSFNPGLGADWEVIAVLPLEDGRLLIGGSFTSFNQRGQGRLAVLKADGSLDESFALPSMLNGTVQQLVQQPDGKILVGGGFSGLVLDTSAPGNTYGGLIRLNSDLTVDLTFRPSSLPGYVNAVGLLPDGRVLVGGNGSVTLYSASGVRDNTFNAGSVSGWVWDVKALGSSNVLIAANQLYIKRTNGAAVMNINTTANVTYGLLAEPDGRFLVAEGGNSTMSFGAVRRYLGVAPTFSIIADPSPLRVNSGASAAFSVNVRGEGPFLFQWRKNGTNIPGATASAYVINNAGPANVARYSCVVTFGAESLTSAEASLTVLGTPVIVQQPRPVHAAVGDTVQLTVDVDASNPVAYQWKKGGIALAGETNQVLTLSGVSQSSAGVFSVDVTAAGSTISSASAAVTVGYVPGALDLSWATGTAQGTNLILRSLARQNDGKILVAGSAAGTRGVFRLNTNGSLDGTFTITNTHPGSAVAVSGNGSVLAAFGTSPNFHLTRLTSTGSRDLTFSNVVFSGSQALFATPQINEIRELPDGRILVLGGFTQVNGVPRTNIVRLFANGVVDTQFVPQVAGAYTRDAIGGYSRTLPDGRLLVQNILFGGNAGSLNRLNTNGQIELIYSLPNSGAHVRAATYQPDGKLLAAVSEGGTIRVLRFDSNGSVDPTFASHPLYKGNLHRPVDLLVQSSGRVLALGYLMRMDGSTVTALSSNWISGVVALNPDGTLDTAFNSFVGAADQGAGPNIVGATLAMPDGRILVAGQFDRWNGVPRNGLAMILDTLVEPAFNQLVTDYTINQGENLVLNPLPYSTGNVTWQWRLNGANLPGQTSTSLALNSAAPIQSGIYTLIGSSPFGTNSFSFHVRVLGKPEIIAQPIAPPAVLANPFQLSVSAIGVAPLNYQWRKGGVNIPGATFASFTNLNAALDDSGSYDVVVQNALGSSTSSVAVVTVVVQPGSLALSISNNLPGVSRIVRERSGSFLLQFSSGITRYSDNGSLDTAFSNAVRSVLGNVTINTIASDEYGRIYIGSSSPFQVRRFLPNGSPDTNYWFGLSSAPTSLALATDGSLFIGTQNSPGIVKLLPDGSFDVAFNAAIVTNLNNAGVVAVSLTDDGRILAALGNGIRRLNANGTLDPSFPPNNISGIRGFAPLSDGRYYAFGSSAGNFSINGVSTQLRHLNRFLPSGLVDPTFNGPAFNSSGVNHITLQENGRLIVVGSFSTVDGATRRYVVRLESTGALDTTFNTGTGPNSIVQSSALLGDNRILIGGGFNQVNDITRFGIAVLNGDIAHLNFTAEPNSIVLNHGEPLHLNGDATGTSAITFHWLKNGALIANASSHSVPSVTTNDTGDYQLVISNLSGIKTSAVARVTVLADPLFLAQPSSTNGFLYKSVTLAPKVQGRAPLFYQWFRNGVALTNSGTNVALTLTNLLFADAGNYSLVASNSLGVSTSAVANLTISILHGSVDLTFDAKGLLQNANGMTMLPDGRFYVAGNYVSNGITLSRSITRLLPDGRFDPTFVQPNPNLQAPRYMAVDPLGRIVCTTGTVLYRLLPDGSFDGAFRGTNLGFNFAIQAVAIQPDAKILVGGSFTAPRQNLLRLNEDGTIDPTFSASAFGSVYGLAVLRDGSIVCGATYNPNIRLQRFLPNGSNYPGFTNVPYGGNSVGITRIIELPDGKILAGGSFASRLQRFLPSGAIDPSFQSPELGGSSHFEMLVERDGKIVVAGDFTSWNNIPAKGLVRLLPNGAVDSTFVGGATAPATPLGLGQQVDGRLIIVGNFTTFDDAARSRVAAAFSTPLSVGITNVPASTVVNLNSTLVLSAGGWSATGAPLTYQWYRNGIVIPGATSASLTIVGVLKSQAGIYSVVISDGVTAVTSSPAHVTVLGEPVFLAHPVSLVSTQGMNAVFTPIVTGVAPIHFQWSHNGNAIAGATNLQLTLNQVTLANAGTYTVLASNSVGVTTSVSAFLTVGSLPAGNLDLSFQTNNGPQSFVNSILHDPSRNRVIVGGNFSSFNGQSRQRIAWLDAGNGNLLGTNGPSLTSLNSLALHPDGGLWIGGGFSTVGGQSRVGLARLFPNAQLDTSVTNLLLSGTGTGVLRIHPFADGSALIGGYFRTAGTTLRSNLARITAEGFIDPNFGASNFVNNGVWALTVQDDGRILIGGDFTAVLGTARTNLARLNADGTVDHSFTNASVVTSPFSRVTGISVQSDGRILICGTFTSVSGHGRQHLARLNANGSLDMTFNPSFNGVVTSVAVQADDKILVGGDFTTVNFNFVQRLVRLNQDGSIDMSFTSGSPNTSVNVIVPLPDGKVLIGGGFTSYNNVSRPYIVRLLGNGQLPPVIVSQPESLSATEGASVSFNVAAGGLNPLRFQWRFNGTNLQGQTAFSLTLTNLGTNQAGNYSVVITNAFGSVTSSIASLTITLGNANGSAFDSWASSAGLDAGSRGPVDDPDDDGLSNAFEYYFGSDPAVASPGSVPRVSTVNVGGTNYVALAFVRSKNAQGVTLSSQASTNLRFSDSLGTVGHSVTDLGNGTERVVLRSAAGTTTSPQQFLRLWLTIE